MNKISYLKSTILLALTVAFFIACDDDFNVLGADIVGIDNFGFGESVRYEAKTTNLDLGAVESSDLPINPFGIYNNPVFGEMTANYVTQLQLAVVNPTIDLTKNPEITSVVMRIPYFSTQTGTETNGGGIYTLDSIYGPTSITPMKLKIYESGYFMRDIDPVDQSVQSYYSDQTSLFESNLVGDYINTGDPNENDNFKFSNLYTTVTAYNATTGAETVTNAAPAIKLNLSKEYFKQKIFNAPAGKLLNNNVFKDYFRGLYFKVEKNGSNAGNLAMLNFKGGIITINYKENANASGTLKTYKTIILNMTGKTASLVNQTSVITPDPERLYLKGNANNSMAVVDLFKDNELGTLRSKKWLINDASLTFTIDSDKMNQAGTDQPLRVYLYDLNNKRQLIDYSLDVTPGTTTAKYNKRIFSGIIKKDLNGRGLTYRIRITNHINNLMKNQDSTNVRLGLVVTEDINTVTNKKIKNPALGGTLKVIPTMSVVHPLGTVLYGSDATDVSKRPKFEIYYTEPKQN